jgi:hypothetical protein
LTPVGVRDPDLDRDIDPENVIDLEGDIDMDPSEDSCGAFWIKASRGLLSTPLLMA